MNRYEELLTTDAWDEIVLGIKESLPIMYVRFLQHEITANGGIWAVYVTDDAYAKDFKPDAGLLPNGVYDILVAGPSRLIQLGYVDAEDESTKKALRSLWIREIVKEASLQIFTERSNSGERKKVL